MRNWLEYYRKKRYSFISLNLSFTFIFEQICTQQKEKQTKVTVIFSSLNVRKINLTYLRGLELPELKEEGMLMV